MPFLGVRLPSGFARRGAVREGGSPALHRRRAWGGGSEKGRAFPGGSEVPQPLRSGPSLQQAGGLLRSPAAFWEGFPLLTPPPCSPPTLEESGAECDEEASERGTRAPARAGGAGAGGPGPRREPRPEAPAAAGRVASPPPRLPLESAAAAPELLVQVAAQLTELQREVARLRERNGVLEAENARLLRG
ncbi:unnamed protein product [Prorocentrum cordatum]|uniref:Uncharacterized protein n=1 Tax=Prorocentrum cordatum TaxID=2364126 RepID=A0ABN9RS02_9DINO|nr:unnamed protein product [Polarella glacialis]